MQIIPKIGEKKCHAIFHWVQKQKLYMPNPLKIPRWSSGFSKKLQAESLPLN